MLIKQAFLRLLVPSMFAAFAISLSEFVDAVVVAQLLGASAMATVSFASPIMILAAGIGSLFGLGGSIEYAEAKGAYRTQRASRILSVSLLAAVGVAMVSAGVLLALAHPLASMIAQGHADAADRSLAYLMLLAASLPVLTAAMTSFAFLPASGRPKLAAGLFLAANLINLFLDVVFMGPLGMGLAGAALATASGYLCALAVFFALHVRGKVGLSYGRVGVRAFALIPGIAMRGAASALSQFGLSLKFAFCSALALFLAGSDGLVVMSVCIQLFSLAAIPLGGVAQAAVPLVAMLHAQADCASIKKIMLHAYGIVVACSFALALVLCLFPGQLVQLYKVANPDVAMVAMQAIKLMSVCIAVRGAVVLFMFYIQALGMKAYAAVLSLLDSVGATVLVSVPLVVLFGVGGLWLIFSASALVVALAVIGCNFVLSKKYPYRFEGLLLFPVDSQAEATELFDVRFNHAGMVDEEGQAKLQAMEREGAGARIAVEAIGQLVELAAGAGATCASLFARKQEGCWIVEARTSGRPFDLAPLGREGPMSLESEHVAGMNCFRLAVSDKNAGGAND